MQQILHSLHYLPCIAYFCAWARSERVCIAVSEPYEKQSYRNRTTILTSQGTLDLIIPVKKSQSQSPLTPEGGINELPFRGVGGFSPSGLGASGASIDYAQKWVDLHLRSIQTAYGKAPFFEYYFEEFAEIYQRKLPLLSEFNIALLTVCQKILQLPQKVTFIEKNIENPENQEIINYQNQIHPKRVIPKAIQDSLKPYTQVFGKSFVPNMSILDLIFCEGMNAKDYL